MSGTKQLDHSGDAIIVSGAPEALSSEKSYQAENGKEICFTAAYESQKEVQMELISKQAALDIINSYGGTDATDPEDKRSDDLVRAIYADVDSIETVDAVSSAGKE